MSVNDPAAGDAPRHRILLVEDHQLVGQGLQTALAANGFDVFCSACATPDGILDEARACRPGVVLLDLELGDAGAGRDLIPPLIGLGARVLVLSGVTDRIELARCLEAGAVGLASKAETFASVLDKVRRAAAGETVTPVGDRALYVAELQDHRSAERARTAPFEALTRREKQVLGMMMEGNSAQTMARESFVSLATVRTQIRSVLQKLGVKSQLSAAAMATTVGWRPDG
jgi:two-component system, NarL family, nitrate/nitrite response regulator NarL